MAIGVATNGDFNSIITVIGVGGGGGNAINNMILMNLNTVNFIVANTDQQALDINKAACKIHLGEFINGAGGKPEIGQKAAERSINDIKELLENTQMLFVTAGMGGGTGTGAAPVIAKIAREMGILVVGIVTRPFDWEGRIRIQNAMQGIKQLKECVDALIVIPNQKLLEISKPDLSFTKAFQMVDEVLYNATKGISDIISKTGMINVDFADVKTIMTDMGDALMGIGKASGQDKARIAALAALNSPLLEGITIQGSKGVLINITGNDNLAMQDVSTVLEIVGKEVGVEANIIHGVVIDTELNDEILVTVVATGFSVKEETQKVTENIKENYSMQITEVVPSKPASTVALDETKSSINQPKPSIIFKTTNVSIKPPKGDSELRKFDSPSINRFPETIVNENGNSTRFSRINEVNFARMR